MRLHDEFELYGERWIITSFHPNGIPGFDPTPYITANPWDKRRKRYKTDRCMCVFEITFTDGRWRPK